VPEQWHRPGQVGSPYTIMTCLPGRPLSEVSAGLDPASLHSLYRSVGQLARSVHSVGQDAFGYLVTHIVEPKADNTAYMSAQFDKKLAEFVAAGDPHRLSRDIERLLARDASSFAECRYAALCHNDLYEGNLLVDDSSGCWELTGLIDVENAIAADPLLDIAKIDCYSIRGNYSKAAGLAAGYGLDVQATQARLDLYRIYHTLELWDWFHQIGQSEPLPGLTRQLSRLLGRVDT
jgi:hygromycin-B 7''-O-kinase